MTEKPIEIEVNEKDKPFVLALTSIALFSGEIGAIVVTGIAYPAAEAAINALEKVILFTGSLVSMAWTYYLVKKNGNSKKE